MSRNIAAFCVAAFLTLAVTAANGGTADSSAGTQQWNFRVYLDDSEIGYHNFSLVEEDGRRQLVTEAEFQVKFLFITAFRYEHVNVETWQGDCLQEIRSQTDANGRKFAVRGVRDEDALAIEAGDGTPLNSQFSQLSRARWPVA